MPKNMPTDTLRLEDEKRLLGLYSAMPKLVLSGAIKPQHLSYPPHKAILAGIIDQVMTPGFGDSIDYAKLESFVSSRVPGVSGENVVSIASTYVDSNGPTLEKARALESKIMRTFRANELEGILTSTISKIRKDTRISPTEEAKRLVDSLSGVITEQNLVAPEESFDVAHRMVEVFRGERGKGFDIGFDEITNAVGKLLPGRIWIVAGFPAHGKSIFTLNMANNIAANGKRVLWVSTEMRSEETMARFMCLHTQRSYESYREGIAANEKSLVDFVDVLAADMQDVMFFEDRFSDIEQIMRQAMWLANESKIDCIVVDYAQNVYAHGHTPNDRQDKVSRGLYNLAVKYNLAVIAVSQLNKDALAGVSQYSLKGSGSLADVASTVLHIKKDGDDPSRFHLKSLKTRFGSEFYGQYVMLQGGGFRYAG